MQALGNDFVVLDQLDAGTEPLTASVVAQLCDRHRGIGCDQLLVIAPPRSDAADIHYRIYNADGGEVGQCGNGVRCVARYLLERRGLGAAGLRVESAGGLALVFPADDGQVRVDMGEPRFSPASLPFVSDGSDEANAGRLYSLEVAGESVSFGICSMGNPHVVIAVDSVAAAPVTQLGPLLEHHPRFPLRTNVGFVECVDSGRLQLRVWERGVGETLACGTGACAAAAVLRARGTTQERMSVDLSGGRLWIDWAGPGHPLWMTGPAETVFEGWITL